MIDPKVDNWKLDGPKAEIGNWNFEFWWMISTKTEPKRSTDTANQWDINTSAQFWKNTSMNTGFWKCVI